MYFVVVAGPRHVLVALLERGADGVQAGHERALLPQLVERAGAHAGHDPHRAGDVGRVRELDADLGDRRAQRAHRERHDVHRAAAHAALEQVLELLAHLRGVVPVVRRPGVLLALGADERAVLDPGDVGRVRQREVGIRPLGVRELLERPRLDQQPRQRVVLLGAAVAPVHVIRLGPCGHLLHPFEEVFVPGRDSSLAHGWGQLQKSASGGRDIAGAEQTVRGQTRVTRNTRRCEGVPQGL